MWLLLWNSWRFSISGRCLGTWCNYSKSVKPVNLYFHSLRFLSFRVFLMYIQSFGLLERPKCLSVDPNYIAKTLKKDVKSQSKFMTRFYKIDTMEVCKQVFKSIFFIVQMEDWEGCHSLMVKIQTSWRKTKENKRIDKRVLRRII